MVTEAVKVKLGEALDLEFYDGSRRYRRPHPAPSGPPHAAATGTGKSVLVRLSNRSKSRGPARGHCVSRMATLIPAGHRSG